MTLGSIDPARRPHARDLDQRPEDATPLVFHHGTPGSARPPRALERAVHAHGLRFVGFSRPGYGGLDPAPRPPVVDVVADTDGGARLRRRRARVVAGWSGGGPHALACAARLPQPVATLVIAGVGPAGLLDLDFLAGMGQDNLDEFGAAFAGESTLRAYLDAQRPGLVGATAEGVDRLDGDPLPPVDRAVLTDEFGADMAAVVRGALRSPSTAGSTTTSPSCRTGASRSTRSRRPCRCGRGIRT